MGEAALAAEEEEEEEEENAVAVEDENPSVGPSSWFDIATLSGMPNLRRLRISWLNLRW
jgi:hypothetical protein